MPEFPLMIKSKLFALEVIRAGTSIGTNIREAFYTHGKADFVML